MEKQSRILIVDDEFTSRQIITAALKNDCELLLAENGEEAIALCREKKPDLILMDVMMPVMDGYQACEAIKNDPEFSDLPIIFLTAADNPSSEMQGLKLGGIDYLMKPVNMDLLRLRVNNHLELKKKNDLIKAQRDQLEQQKKGLEEALARIKRLEGIIPICMHCKRIRSVEEIWERLELYIEKHSDARFSHGICSTCLQVHYPELMENPSSEDPD